MQVNDSDLFCLCNFPQVPANIKLSICQAVAKGLVDNSNVQFLNRPKSNSELEGFTSSTTFSIGDTEYTRSRYRRFFVSPEVEQWVKDNISANCSEISAQYIGDGAAFSPHTDGGPRQYILNYLIQAGGEAVETQWWQEAGEDLIRPGTPLQFPFTDQLQLVKSTVFGVGSWSALYGKVIHSVTNLTGKRIALSIAISKEEFAKLKEQYNLELKYYG